MGPALPGSAFSIAAAADGEGEIVFAGRNVMMGYAHGAADLARGDDLPTTGSPPRLSA